MWHVRARTHAGVMPGFEGSLLQTPSAGYRHGGHATVLMRRCRRVAVGCAVSGAGGACLHALVCESVQLLVFRLELAGYSM